MQEFNREANTLSSSQDTETTRKAVELKVLIEQMREQSRMWSDASVRFGGWLQSH
jgi:uncharacterized protein YicC (UPF0701 family)